MSRIGKQPIPLPKGVKVSVSGDRALVEGPKGKLTLKVESCVEVKVSDSEAVCLLKPSELPDARARFGLVRSLLANMVEGVSKGFTEELEINGVGYRAAVSGKKLELTLGFSHPISFDIPEGITITVEKLTRLSIQGVDRQLVGQIAAEIRSLRLPEPYKGKGIKYANEVIRRKAGKAAATAAS